MNQSLLRLLTPAERTLVLATEPRRLDPLDEDELVELHARVRRARNKWTTLHRRQASAQVRADRSRGQAGASNVRTAAKAEVFEDALSRVSRRLAVVARERAAALRAERLAAARAARDRPASRPAPAKRATRAPRAPKRPTTSTEAGRRGDGTLRSPANLKISAHTRAAGRRAQARRDAR